MTQNPTLPRPLVQAVREQRAVLFLGAGASADAQTSTGAKLRTSKELALAITARFLSDKFRSHDLISVAGLAIDQHGDTAVYDFIRSHLLTFKPTNAHRLLPQFRWKALITTNYDSLVEDAYNNDNNGLQRLVEMVKDTDRIDHRMAQHRSPLPYYKLHGCVNYIHDADIPPVLTADSYNIHDLHRRRLFERVADLSAEYPIIFCGYSLRDLHILKLITRIEAQHRPTFYFVTRSLEPEENSYWARRRIETVQCTFTKFMEHLDQDIPILLRRPEVRPDTQHRPIRRHFRTNEQESDDLADYLLRDVEFVHSGIPSDEQRPDDFYSGIDRGWNSIRQNYDVQRRVSDLLVEEAIVDSGSNTKLFVLTGPGGYGKSISLKRTAWELATSYDQLVLWLRYGGRLDANAIEELLQFSGKRVFLFIDRTSLYAEPLHDLLEYARSRNWLLSVITAERQNEWNIRCARLDKFDPHFFTTSRLNRSEVERLLELLERHHCLGVMKELSHDQRIKQFTENLDRQLLVMLHEVTKGKRFHEIVLDEYKGIIPEEAQQLYLDVCTLHQFSVPVRAGLISRISGISFTHFESELFDPLETLIHTELHPVLKDQMYGARHPKVAEMVFLNACEDSSSRSKQVQRVISSLDPGYMSDAESLSGLVRGRTMIEVIEGVESAREVYDAAIARAPTLAFVYQQQAIFEYLHPMGSSSLSIRAAEEARRLSPENSTVIHTQAEAYRRAAIPERVAHKKVVYRRLARRYVAELPATSGRQALSTLAKLHVDELEDLIIGLPENASPEDTDVLSQCTSDAERAIQRFMQAYPDEPDIIETDARLKKVLGDDRRALSLLEQAWRKGARGSGIAIRLARIYREVGKIDDEVSILRSAIERDTNNKDARLELARSLFRIDYDNSREEAERYLASSFSKGDNNHQNRFLYACYTFLVGRYAEAAELFKEVGRRAPASFKPVLRSDSEQIRELCKNRFGVLLRKIGSYGFVKMVGCPDDVYTMERRSEADNWDNLRVNSNITFDLDFNRKGPVAVNVKPA